MAESSPPAADVLKEGFLTKQGGGFRTWKQRWCVLRAESLSYYVKRGNTKPKKTIDLRQGRGVRPKKQCSLEAWPGDAKFCFGVATSDRTWFFYGPDEKDVKKWSELIQQCIDKVGKPTSDWQSDPEGRPEGAVSKVFRSTAKQAAKHAKDNIPSTGNEYADAALKTGLDVAESQADADPNTSMKDRLKMAGGDVISGVADTVDNPAVSVAANIAKDQLEADDDLSLKQRLALAGGSAVEGVGDVTGIDAVNIAGGVIKDQATADEDASLQERLAIGVGSAAGGIKDSSDDPLVHGIAKAVEKGAGKVADHYGVNHTEMPQKNAKNKKNIKGYMMNVTVEDQTGASINMVVDSSISAIALAFLAGSELHLALNKDLTLLEVINDIGIERIIEDHEVVKDVVSLWPKKSSVRLVVKERKDKHQLWTSAMMKEEIRGFVENNTVTREIFSLNTLKKKNKWHNELYCFRHDGVYSMPVGGDTMPVHKQTLVAKFTTHNMYFASKLTKRHPLSGPTSFGLILKPDDSFKEKDCIIMCAQDLTSWMKWIQLFRLLKHGAQLKGNYLAVQERLKARQSKSKLL